MSEQLSSDHFAVANYQQLQQQLKQHLVAVGRAETSATILPVSKRKPAEDIQALVDIEQYHFAENYLQEAVNKMDRVNQLVKPEQKKQLRWHFVGSLQTKKAKLLSHHFHWFHALDQLKHAQKISAFRSHPNCPISQPINVCIQINWFEEPQKGGIFAADLMDFVHQMAPMPNICLRGLMLIGQFGLNEADTKEGFANMQRLFNLVKRQLMSSAHLSHMADGFDTLSMGMSQDWRLAIEHGATIIRIGTDIFGERQ